MQARESSPSIAALKWLADTHPGRYRTRNEDAFVLMCFDTRELCYLGKQGHMASEGKHFLFAVSDGIGGGKGGGYASQSALRSLSSLISQTFHRAASSHEIPYEVLLRRFVEHMHQRLLGLSRSYEECHRMGATLTLGWIHNEQLRFAHLGDSRLFHLRGPEQYRQLSEDHTLAAQKVRQGILTPQQAKRDAASHVLTRSLGAGARPDEPQVGSLTLSPGDRLLFCTDGLTDTLSDYRIAKTLYDPPPYLEGLDPMQSLIREALDGSGRDNLTAILVDCLPGESL